MLRCAFLTVLLLFFNVLALPQHHKPRRPTSIFKNNVTGGLLLPDNATSIRADIIDTFSCQNRIYGFYADIENECQIFHVCFPLERNTMRWSFICPAETVFNQATFVCTRTESSIPCEESEKYYSLNEEIGKDVEEDEGMTNPPNTEIDPPIFKNPRNPKFFTQEELPEEEYHITTSEYK